MKLMVFGSLNIDHLSRANTAVAFPCIFWAVDWPFLTFSAGFWGKTTLRGTGKHAVQSVRGGHEVDTAASKRLTASRSMLSVTWT